MNNNINNNIIQEALAFYNKNLFKYDEKTHNKFDDYFRYLEDTIVASETITYPSLLAFYSYSYYLLYYYGYYSYKKRIDEGIDFLSGTTENLQWLVDNLNNKSDEERIVIQLNTIKENLAISYYNISKLYMSINDLDKAIDYLEKAVNFDHIISMQNLAYLYGDEQSPYYNLALSKELYFKGANININEKYISPNVVILRKYVQFLMCLRLSNIMNEEKKYNESILYYDKALEINKKFKFYDESDIEKAKMIAESYSNTKIIKTEKRKVLEEIFSEQAKKHITEEQYMLMESSLLIYDYLNSLNNDSLDYSGAIISLLKCLEGILFQVIGLDYYDYIKQLDNIDYSLIPNEFRKKYKKNYLDELEEKDNIRMELGSFIYACSYYDFNIQKYKVNSIFNKFMKSREINDFDNKIDDFVKKLKEVKDDYRNPTAHKDRINKLAAEKCLDYLLSTIKFINTCLEYLYKD